MFTTNPSKARGVKKLAGNEGLAGGGVKFVPLSRG